MKAVMTSAFRDVGNRIPHLGKASDVAAEELGWLLVDAVEITLGSRSCTHSHIVVGEDFFQLILGSDGFWGKASKPVHDGWRMHDGKIVHHDTGVSPGGVNSSGISLQPLCWIHPPLVGLDPSKFETMGPLKCSERPREC